MASNTAAAHGAHDAHEHHPTGWRRFVYSTNHKDIGTMYLVFALVAGVIGGLMSVAIRVVSDRDYTAWLDQAKKKYATDDSIRPTAVAAASEK